MACATFFLSTGRCGTQWVAKQLQEHYSDLAVTTHEPLQTAYLPCELFAHKDPTRLKTANEVLAHVGRIEQRLAHGPYIECGWQCYAMIPYFADRFSGQIRIVHLTRHPIPTASSMVTHRYYSDPPRKDRLTEILILSPFDKGVRFPKYQERWARMNEYEKCLYFWTEVNAYALSLESELGAPWLRLGFEQLFTPQGLGQLLDFLELPRRQGIFSALDQRFDRHQYRTVLDWDITAITSHPEVLAVAKALGYDPLVGDDQALRKRYRVERADLKLTDLPGPTLVNRTD